MKKLLELESLPVLPDGGIYFFYYLCGYLFACGNVAVKPHVPEEAAWVDNSDMQTKDACAWKKRAVLLVVVLIFAGMICSRLIGDYSVQMAYNYPFTVVVSLLFMWLVRRKESYFAGKNMQTFRALGELSFAVYLIHPVFLNLLYKGVHVSLLDFPIGISLPVVFLTVLFLATGAAWVLCKIPLLKKYVL